MKIRDIFLSTSVVTHIFSSEFPLPEYERWVLYSFLYFSIHRLFAQLFLLLTLFSEFQSLSFSLSLFFSLFCVEQIMTLSLPLHTLHAMAG